MTSNREERFLQRQRGAGIHKIKDVDFGLAFPAIGNAPLRPQRSSRRTPQQDQQPLLPQRSSRRTPKPAQALPSQQSIRRTPTSARNDLPQRPSPYDIPRTEDKERLSSSQATRSDRQGSVSKKRKITGLSSARRLSTIAQAPSLDTPSTRGRELRSATKHAERAQRPAYSGGEGSSDLVATVRDPLQPESGGTPSLIANTRGQRRSKGISGTDNIQSIPSTEASVEESEPVVSPEIPLEKQEQSRTHQNQPQILKAKRRTRKSIGKIPKRRKQLEVTVEEAENPEEGLEEDPPEVQSNAPAVPPRATSRPNKALATVQEEDLEEDDGQRTDTEDAERGKNPKAAKKPSKQHSRPSGSRVTAPRPAQGRSTIREKKSSGRQQESRVSDEAIAEESQITSGSRRSKESVPIIVQRLSRLQALDYGDEGQDILYGPPAFPKRNGVNAVDVLGQVCREIVARAVEAIDMASETGRGATKGERKRKKEATKAFGGELEGRLLDMSEALDNNWALSVRLRQANKEKLALREELLRIRREREKVALRTDEVRRLHEEASKSSQDRNSLNTALFDIELAVERGRTQQQARTENNDAEGGSGAELELLLRTVAARASSASSGRGLLTQVKEFNAFLERTATLLES